MNGLISKAKALKAIEAAARLCVADANHNYLMGFQDAAEAVAQVEAEAMTEQPEIVRCKDCKHIQKWRSEESAKKFGQIYECARNVLNCPKSDDFCSYAERKEG